MYRLSAFVCDLLRISYDRPLLLIDPSAIIISYYLPLLPYHYLSYWLDFHNGTIEYSFIYFFTFLSFIILIITIYKSYFYLRREIMHNKVDYKLYQHYVIFVQQWLINTSTHMLSRSAILCWMTSWHYKLVPGSFLHIVASYLLFMNETNVWAYSTNVSCDLMV